MLSDHNTGLDSSYFRPSEKQVLEEYLKAEPYLTISNELRLQTKVETLQIEKDSFLALRQELDELKKILGM
jgi:hypothetical protein